MAEKFSNGLSDAELERLSILSEELGEAVQAVGKIMRHGYESVNPFVADSPDNRMNLMKEIGDIQWIVGMMINKNDLGRAEIEIFREEKGAKIWRFLHHQS